jgi:integration host factor subunit beta
LEAVGRLRNLHYESIYDPEDILGHGWITAQFRISRVLRGRPTSRLITIRYLAHTYRSERSPIRLRLRANPNGAYTVCAEPGGDGLVCG